MTYVFQGYCIAFHSIKFLATVCIIPISASSRHIVRVHLFLCIWQIVSLFQNRLLVVLIHPFHAANQKVRSRIVTKCEFCWVSGEEWQ